MDEKDMGTSKICHSITPTNSCVGGAMDVGEGGLRVFTEETSWTSSVG